MALCLSPGVNQSERQSDPKRFVKPDLAAGDERKWNINMRNSVILTARRIKAFQQTVYDYYERYGRDLPWRQTTDPYRILVSEVMLQQTQVPRVLLKYDAFIHRFPGIPALAVAPLHDVLSVWQGLGYNRRALMLKQAAEQIVAFHDGIVPREEDGLVSLPGIGPATARAVRTFAFNEPVILIETNIRAVFIHHFFPPDETVSDAALRPLIEQTLDRNNPRLWYNALMDYGTFLKKAHVNPARKSAHHQVQSPFQGSIRQVRGAVIRLIVEKVRLLESDLIAGLPFDKKRIRHVLDQLAREGIILREHGSISIG